MQVRVSRLRVSRLRVSRANSASGAMQSERQPAWPKPSLIQGDPLDRCRRSEASLVRDSAWPPGCKLGFLVLGFLGLEFLGHRHRGRQPNWLNPGLSPGAPLVRC